MVDKTYANLSTVTTTADTDLIAVYPTAGPLKVIAWLNLVAELVTDLTPSFLRVSQNLADLNSAGVARGNLGLGSSSIIDTGTASGTIAVLDANGKTPISTLPGGYLATTGNLTVTAAHNGKLVDVTANSPTITLPDPATVGETFSVDVRNSGTGVVTLDPTAGTIDGGSTATMISGTVRTVVNDGTNSFTTPEGPQGWTVLDTRATTSGTNVVFGPISQAYAEIMFIVNGFKGSTDDTLFVQISSDGVSYTTGWSPTGANPAGYIGTMNIPSYTSAVGSLETTMGLDSAAPYAASPSTSATKQIYRLAGGIAYVKFSTPTGTLSTGSIKMQAR